MTPIAQEHAGFAIIGSSSSNKPVNEIVAILIVNQAV
jgi:hypothetical protein